jgi:hypothetical protein
MNNLQSRDFEVITGSSINSTIAKMIEESKRDNVILTTVFNKVKIEVTPDSGYDAVLEKYNAEYKHQQEQFMESAEGKQFSAQMKVAEEERVKRGEEMLKDIASGEERDIPGRIAGDAFRNK